MSSCTTCEPGHFSGSGAVVCNACPGGTRSSDDLTECEDCEVSKYERCHSHSYSRIIVLTHPPP